MIYIEHVFYFYCTYSSSSVPVYLRAVVIIAAIVVEGCSYGCCCVGSSFSSGDGGTADAETKSPLVRIDVSQFAAFMSLSGIVPNS